MHHVMLLSSRLPGRLYMLLYCRCSVVLRFTLRSTRILPVPHVAHRTGTHSEPGSAAFTSLLPDSVQLHYSQHHPSSYQTFQRNPPAPFTST